MLQDKRLNIKEGEEVSSMLIKEGNVLVNAAAALAQDVKNSTSVSPQVLTSSLRLSSAFC